MPHTESLATIQHRDQHNAPTVTITVSVDVETITHAHGLIIDNRYLAIVERCAPVCHAALVLTLVDGSTIDVAAGSHPHPDQAGAEINRLCTWLTGAPLTSESEAVSQ